MEASHIVELLPLKLAIRNCATLRQNRIDVWTSLYVECFFSVALSNELLLLTETMEGGRSASRGRVASDQNDDGAILAASSEPHPDSIIFHFSENHRMPPPRRAAALQ